MMRLHDCSPRPIRLIGCHTVEQWTSSGLLRNFAKIRRNTRSDLAAVAELGRWISQDVEPERTAAVYGPDHPEARAPMARRA